MMFSTLIRILNTVFLLVIAAMFMLFGTSSFSRYIFYSRAESPVYTFVYSFFSSIFGERSEIVAPEHFVVFSSEPVHHRINFRFEKYNAVLEIPRLSIKGPIVDGKSETAMERGFWHYPSTGTLLDLKNIVVVGHRYLKVPPAQDTFFNLDKVKKGDLIKITSDLGVWEFSVVDKKVVSVEDTWVLLPRPDTLTLITCHPLWTDRQRLVIIARLIRDSELILR